jgi:hypothetical protein
LEGLREDDSEHRYADQANLPRAKLIVTTNIDCLLENAVSPSESLRAAPVHRARAAAGAPDSGQLLTRARFRVAPMPANWVRSAKLMFAPKCWANVNVPFLSHAIIPYFTYIFKSEGAHDGKFVKMHKTLKIMPGMAGGVSVHLWSVGDIVDLIERREALEDGSLW